MQQPHPIATWNTRKDYWEGGQQDIFGRLDVYSETLPTSGMTRRGQLYGLPTLEHPTTAPAYSSLPTPNATMGERGAAAEIGGRCPSGHSRQVDLNTVVVRGMKTLPTPLANEYKWAGDSPGIANRDTPPLSSVGTYFLPTPTASDRKRDTSSPSGMARKSPRSDSGGETLSHPSDNGHERAWSPREGGPGSSDCHNRDVEWGEYAPAVRRWERIVGPAPAPTEPNSRGNPRLNAAFAEWMMGLPPGHVTAPEIGLTRAQQLKAIGNGVCPQQAEAALRSLLSTPGMLGAA